MPGNDPVDMDEQRFKTGDADSYNAVVEHFERYTERFSRHMPGPMLAMADLPENATVLDVGTGTGIIALAAAAAADPRGKVVGIDLSDGMLAAAAARARREGLEGRTEFLKMDAENLEFADNGFDAALSLYALRHFPNPGRSVKEIFRVLKPGASIVVAVGSQPSLLSMDGVKAMIRRIGSIGRKATGRELQACAFINALVEEYIPRGKGHDLVQWAEHHHGFTGSVRKLVEAAGFGNIRSGWKGQYSIIDSVEDFWLLQMTFSSVARKRIQGAGEVEVGRLRSEFSRRCEQVLRKNGRLVYQTGAAIVTGIKPIS